MGKRPVGKFGKWLVRWLSCPNLVPEPEGKAAAARQNKCPVPPKPRPQNRPLLHGRAAIIGNGHKLTVQSAGGFGAASVRIADYGLLLEFSVRISDYALCVSSDLLEPGSVVLPGKARS